MNTVLSAYKGDLIYMEFPGQPTVVLNSTQAVTDLLEKPAAIYSDRPLTLASEM